MATKQRVSPEERERLISETAYLKALGRGFSPGDALGDWLAAEREIDARFDVAPHDKKLADLYEQLAEVSDRVRDLAAKLKRDARHEWAEEFERIQRLREGFADKLEEIRVHSGAAKQKARRQALKLRRELLEALNRVDPRDD
jgi:Protein of unknown function (DUF2934)